MRCEAAVWIFLDVLGGLQWIGGNLQHNAGVGPSEKRWEPLPGHGPAQTRTFSVHLTAFGLVSCVRSHTVFFNFKTVFGSEISNPRSS